MVILAANTVDKPVCFRYTMLNELCTLLVGMASTFGRSEHMKRFALVVNPVIVRILGGLLGLIGQRLMLVGEEQ